MPGFHAYLRIGFAERLRVEGIQGRLHEDWQLEDDRRSGELAEGRSFEDGGYQSVIHHNPLEPASTL
jgi:hypothetical protein